LKDLGINQASLAFAVRTTCSDVRRSLALGSSTSDGRHYAKHVVAFVIAPARAVPPRWSAAP